MAGEIISQWAHGLSDVSTQSIGNDGKHLMIGENTNKIHIFSKQGTLIRTIPVNTINNSYLEIQGKYIGVLDGPMGDYKSIWYDRDGIEIRRISGGFHVPAFAFNHAKFIGVDSLAELAGSSDWDGNFPEIHATPFITVGGFLQNSYYIYVSRADDTIHYLSNNFDDLITFSVGITGGISLNGKTIWMLDNTYVYNIRTC